MSHTPGPWKYSIAHAPCEVDKNPEWEIYTEKGINLATVWGWVADCNNSPRLDAEDNVRVMTAGPVMLEALEAVQQEGLLILSPHVEETWEKVVYAIKLAKGEL